MPRKIRPRYPANKIQKIAAELIDILGPLTRKFQICGSLRRGKATVADIDLVITPSEAAREALVSLGFSGGSERVIGTFKDIDTQVWFVEDEFWGGMILYATGPRSLAVNQRSRARSLGMVLNQRGLKKDGKYLASRTEEEIYSALGLKYQEPSDRESGEIVFEGALEPFDSSVKIVNMSGSKGDYQVQYDKETGYAECTCPHFRFRLSKLKPAGQCKHIQKVFNDVN